MYVYSTGIPTKLDHINNISNNNNTGLEQFLMGPYPIGASKGTNQ